MTDQEIQKDRNTRADACKTELEAILKKYEFALLAEDNWTPNTKIRVEISFVDSKKYPKADLAQPEAPKAPILPEGVQADGSVVINPESLATVATK